METIELSHPSNGMAMDCSVPSLESIYTTAQAKSNGGGLVLFDDEKSGASIDCSFVGLAQRLCSRKTSIVRYNYPPFPSSTSVLVDNWISCLSS